MKETETAADNLTKHVTSPAVTEYKHLPNNGVEEALGRREATADILITRPIYYERSTKTAILSSMNAGAMSTALLAVCNHVEVRKS